ncbi:MAG TPA: hypothetical protein VK066_30220 [Chloroflexota bacterium]|nr:hypothetical protein [Chloroflexota bacterium]
MVRHALLGAAAGGLLLLAPHRALATQQTHLATPGAIPEVSALAKTAAPRLAAGGVPTPIYAVDNPAQPGDAFPNSPYSGGTA